MHFEKAVIITYTMKCKVMASNKNSHIIKHKFRNASFSKTSFYNLNLAPLDLPVANKIYFLFSN